jgi:uncharacterized protein (DUF1330 family)
LIHRNSLKAALCGAAVILAGALALQAADAPTPKGYLIGEIDVRDAETYRTYAAQVPAILAKHGGRYLARGGATVPYEGAAPASRVVIVEFPSVAAARAFYESPEYTAAAKLRQKASASRMFIVEGFVAPPSVP